jgi:dipeptidyl aminopeptidase/acylaminoacyl peptidase
MRKIKTHGIWLVIALFISNSLLLSQEEKADSKAWTINDVLNQQSASSFDISSCGKWVVWVKSNPDKEENQNVTDLFLSSLVDSTMVQLTRGKHRESNPKWSPDGKMIAFLSVRGKEKGQQIWLMNTRGGEPWTITDLKKGVQAYEWRNEKQVIFSAREDPSYYENELKEKKDDATVAGDQEHFWPVRLFQANIQSKKIERLSHNTGKIAEFAVSPDGRWVVTSESQDVHYPYDHRLPPKQFLYDLQEKSREEIFKETNMKPRRFVWALDGSGFYCSQPLASKPGDDYVSVQTLYYFDLKSKKYQPVPLNWKWQLGFFGYYITKDGLLASLAAGTKNKLAFYQPDGNTWKQTLLEDENAENIFIQHVDKKGERVIFSYSTASILSQINAGRIDGNKIVDQKEIIKINKNLTKKNIARSEVISWKGAKNDQVEGILYYPHHFEEGKRYPLMCVIHGGPAGADIDAFSERWSNYPNLLASKNCFVLKVNYHGSGNYGLKWVESIKEHYYEYEVPDILTGIDYVIKKGLVDQDKLGIMGWSNGAILTIACVIEKPDMFKVCAPGAGDVNWTSDYGNCAFGAGFDNAYFGGPPWERPDYYIKKSPLFKMDRVKTPTIIFFGTNDTNVPTEQGWEHYRALQQIGKAPVRFILFPGEPHGLRKISHQRRKMEEELAWFDKYLFKPDSYRKPDEVLKKDSPLALAIKKRKISQVLGYYGIKEKGRLISEMEMVNDSLKVARFEVTRAQYMVFKHDYIYPPGTDNYPVNNITFEQAKAYCQWLSQLTGQKYDLPTEKEMKRLISKNKSNLKNENTLDYWAGYSPTPDEVEELQPTIAELELSNLLLMEVCSRKPMSEELMIFDIGGNVAEWCVTESSEGKIMGGSAVSPTDPKMEYQVPRMEYVGFRVVLR